jgi:glycosyltransferase involved in cell wall biosynthesis
MRLLVISHTPHYCRGEQLVGWGPTVRELDVLASLFTELVHIAPLHDDPAPASALPYTSAAVHVQTVSPAGGITIKDKLHIVRLIPRYFWTIRAAMANADVVHVRCPANISLIAILYLTLRRRPFIRWTKYAGNWQPEQPDPLSYRFQRWWLGCGWQGGVVTVNGRWPHQPSHIHALLNPSLSETEIKMAQETVSQKRLTSPLRLLFVGRIETAKGIGQTLKIVSALKMPLQLDIIGDGAERIVFEQQAVRLGIAPFVQFHGWQPRPALNRFYKQAHIILLPSLASEGWPKVLSEAMAYGVVPLASSISAIPQILAEIGSGKTHHAHDVAAFIRSICEYWQSPDQWKRESQVGIQAAHQFTYEAYVHHLQQLFINLSTTNN